MAGLPARCFMLSEMAPARQRFFSVPDEIGFRAQIRPAESPRYDEAAMGPVVIYLSISNQVFDFATGLDRYTGTGWMTF